MNDVTTMRWGVIGTGGIASTFVRDLGLLPDAECVAVGSRSQESADRFGDQHGVARRHATYADLVADPDVDIVYVATPHPGHHDAAMLAIRAEKHVLCEKPFTMRAAEAESLVAAARAHDVFLMEAMWARFNPQWVRIRELLAEGALGDVRAVMASHNQLLPREADNRWYAPELGGGALLDLGIYVVSLAALVFGAPAKVTAVSEKAFTGVDETTSILLQYDGDHAGAQSVLMTTLGAAGPNTASIVGTEARIEVEDTFYRQVPFTRIAKDGTVLERFAPEVEGHGMRHEAAEVMRCIRAGKRESAVMPLDESLAIMRTLDEIRAQIGLTYPGE